ncbi:MULTISPECIES: hypothetical protein [Mycolicibacterium]|uniref:Uncharacterized protein n=1 Tax=Mycolicibacterium canariasense TaxID=228230 RepID=A0A100WD18_MYCCR|nr:MULTISPECIES: hypothetical protein [Mycolicibacterium]MCC9184578.1 hypothetical protein [Mycolicibacterium mageritense]MCV7212716.1 hypothetical protein [Mycolicibacterium canariasense]ORV09780.1 hypothetical protein AWB94_08755 [Mycolicibacterium canariasense]GAS95724.1 uncharacterized protein RMCC_2690 [Mycolicibacterium canariasense]
MSIPTLADIDMTAHFPQLPPQLSPPDSDDNALGMVQVRIAPLIEPGPLALAGLTETVTETVLDMQLIIDYTLALARRTAARIQRGHVDYIEHPHQHPTSGVTCLRCAVLGTSRDLTVANALLEILTLTNADEEWNCSSDCTDTRIISRLRRLAVSAAVFEELYGPRWGEVMLTCLRIEAADFRLLHHLVRQHNTSRVLTVHTRQSLSAYHLATVVCPWTSRGGGTVTPMLRGSVGIRLAVATAAVAIGEPPAWLDHLPAPVL